MKYQMLISLKQLENKHFPDSDKPRMLFSLRIKVEHLGAGKSSCSAELSMKNRFITSEPGLMSITI